MFAAFRSAETSDGSNDPFRTHYRSLKRKFQSLSDHCVQLHATLHDTLAHIRKRKRQNRGLLDFFRLNEGDADAASEDPDPASDLVADSTDRGRSSGGSSPTSGDSDDGDSALSKEQRGIAANRMTYKDGVFHALPAKPVPPKPMHLRRSSFKQGTVYLARLDNGRYAMKYSDGAFSEPLPIVPQPDDGAGAGTQTIIIDGEEVKIPLDIEMIPVAQPTEDDLLELFLSEPSMDEFTAYAKDLLKRIINHHDSWPFRYPVDPVALRIPEYPDIIKNPMSLWDVQRRLRAGEYKGAEEQFDGDVRLIFENALMYNPKGTDVHAMAVNIITDIGISVGDIVRTTFICIPDLEARKFRKASNVPRCVCRRLGRRRGKIPRWWPSFWFTNARLTRNKKL